MAEKILNARIQNRCNSTDEFEVNDFKTLPGELVYFSDTHKVKISGQSGGALSDIPFIRVDSTDVNGLQGKMDNKISFSEADPDQLVIIDGSDIGLTSTSINDPLGPTPEIRLKSIRGSRSRDFYTPPASQVTRFPGIPFGYNNPEMVVRFTFEVVKGTISPTDRFEICRFASAVRGKSKVFRLRRWESFTIDPYNTPDGRTFFTIVISANVYATGGSGADDRFFDMIKRRDTNGKGGMTFFCRIRRVEATCPDPDDFREPRGLANDYFHDFSNIVKVKATITKNPRSTDPTEDGHYGVLFKY